VLEHWFSILHEPLSPSTVSLTGEYSIYLEHCLCTLHK